jgi:hypothetical protein
MASDVTAFRSQWFGQRRRGSGSGASSAAARGPRVGPRTQTVRARRRRWLPAAARADPVGNLMPREHVANAGDAAVSTADHGEPLQRERRTRTVSQQMLKALKVAQHVAVDERDPDAGVHRETTVFPAERGGGRIGVEEPLQVGGGLHHVATVARRADASSLARERDDKPLAAARAQRTAESEAKERIVRSMAPPRRSFG